MTGANEPTGTRALRVLGWALAPFAAALPALVLYLIPHLGEGSFDTDAYLRYREIWGGNPSEVYSHFLDLVLLGGNVFASALNVLAEAITRAHRTEKGAARWASAWYWLGLLASGSVATALDAEHGEGTVFIVYWFGFLPVLFATHWLLRALTDGTGWRVAAALKLGSSCVAAHAALQYLYEPSVTGAPNLWFAPLWLAGIVTNLAIAVHVVRRPKRKD